MNNLLGLFFLCLFSLLSCGSGSDGGVASNESASKSASSSESTGDNQQAIRLGRFMDSAVEGLRYLSEDQIGVTDAQGTFHYREGSRVKFSIGDIVIGEADAQATMTPVTFVAGDDELEPVVTNIARFIQTLDDDGNPGNGITITQGIRDLAISKTIDFNQSILAFEDDGDVQTVVAELTALTKTGARELIAAEEAQAHLRTTLLGLFAGKYTGTFDGVHSGSFELTIDVSGNISGSGCVDSDSSSATGEGSVSTSESFCSSVTSLDISGAIQSSGEFNVISESTIHTVILNGSVGLDGAIAGTWENRSMGKSGTFTGHQEAEGSDSGSGETDFNTDQCTDIGTTHSSCSSTSSSFAE